MPPPTTLLLQVDSGLRPDVISYTVMIKALGAGGRVDAAEELFLSMQAKANHFSDPVKKLASNRRALYHA
jgi:pentatricopeptide repeat protein